jgi:hypothetical protein
VEAETIHRDENRNYQPQKNVKSAEGFQFPVSSMFKPWLKDVFSTASFREPEFLPDSFGKTGGRNPVGVDGWVDLLSQVVPRRTRDNPGLWNAIHLGLAVRRLPKLNNRSGSWAVSSFQKGAGGGGRFSR